MIKKPLILGLSVFCQTSCLMTQTQNQIPQKVYRYCYVVQSKEWYQTQEKLWQAELHKNPKNEDAWYNYFFAARYGWAQVSGQTDTREALMDSIYQEMGKAISHSWVYHYIHYYNYATDFARLEKAYQINPHAPDLYWEFIKEYTLNGQKEKRKEFCRKLYDSRDISTGVYNLCYNMLNSSAKNSILFTNGDTDTYPAWVLQEAQGIRNDVLVLNIHGSFYYRNYLKSSLSNKRIHLDVDQLSRRDVGLYLEGFVKLLTEKYPGISIHLAPTVYSPYYEKFRDKWQWTGFVLTYQESPSGSDEIHREIVENQLRLDYLDHDWYAESHVSKPLVDRLNLLYVDPFLKLAEHYYLDGDADSANQWKTKAYMLARRVNDHDAIKKIEAMPGGFPTLE